MINAERIQTLIHKLEVDSGGRWLNYIALTLIVLALAVWYDTHCYRNFNSSEAMDAAQVGRHLAEGKGFTTDFVRPFSVYLLERHNGGLIANQITGTNAAAAAQLDGRHPDLANAPLYPLLLAGLWTITQPDWKLAYHKPFWSDGGRFLRYKPEFEIAILNQILLAGVVLLTFMVAKAILDLQAAWLAALLMFCSDTLWKYSVSGLPTLLLLVIFLGVTWCLVAFEAQGRLENPPPRRQCILAVLAGVLVGLGMLTRYSFGWVIVPVVVFLILFGGRRRATFIGAVVLAGAIVVSPWLVRNLVVSGTLFGTAGFAILDGTFIFPGTHLMQSLTPDLSAASWLKLYPVKLFVNLKDLLANEVPRLGGGWVGVLFLTGLLLGLRNVVARRLRYFTLFCLGLFLAVTAMGRTGVSDLSPDLNTENQLVLLMPLAAIFGVAFFLTLLNQMNLPSLQVRYGVMVLVIVLLRLQFVLTLLPPKVSPIAFPPYNPPDIQKFSVWMKPDELLMSDVPWAVAWYGGRQCSWTTLNCQYEFVSLNDYVKPVNGLYLTLSTLDSEFFSKCLAGSADSWSSFAFRVLAFKQLPKNFPLSSFPLDSLNFGVFLSDQKRW